ncbi:MAG: M15 family metallopeptidase [Treponema sp.]|nr:M15 family metallopeptidase [Treponema sp.]
MIRLRVFAVSFIFFTFFTCTKNYPQSAPKPDVNQKEDGNNTFFLNVLNKALLPENISANILKAVNENPSFVSGITLILRTDPYLWKLVDKNNSLGESYAPDDLVELKKGSYLVNRKDLTLRKTAADSLEEMAQAAKKEEVTLTASSAYRSYSYQAQVYDRNVREMGKESADRESARPGFSQHQLGLVVDFGSISDAFTGTKEEVWLSRNAWRYGWSLSFPEGMESITGYRWESWHYRYVGAELAKFINDYFNGIQQYALQFLKAYSENKLVQLQNIHNNLLPDIPTQRARRRRGSG